MNKLLTALFLGLTAIVYSQNTLKGSVTNLKNLKLEHVSVNIPDLHLETFTSNTGEYKFENLPTGTFAIIFNHKQYDEFVSNVVIQNSETIYDVQLSESHSHHIEEVIVSTAFNKAQRQNVMKVEHASVKELQQKGVTTLMEGLATIPGVANVSTGTSIGKPVIRGLSGNRVLVYAQGVRLENQQFGEEHGLGLNDSGVESVEVIKGPASLLYGSDALGGVLYFIPEKFASKNTYVADFSQKYFSNTLGSSTSFGLKTAGEHWKFNVRGSHNTHSDYTTGNDERVTNSRFNETDAKMALGYTSSRFNSVFRYNVNLLNVGLPDAIAEQNTDKMPLYPRQAVLGQIASWANTIYLKKSKIETQLGYIGNQRKEFEDAPVALLNMNLKTFNYDLKYHLPKMAQLETILGVQGMHQTNVNFGEELLIPNAKTKDFGVLATSMLNLKKNVFQAGFRFDTRNISTENHGVEGEEVYFKAIQKQYNSFNASLGYKTTITEKVNLRFNLASGFRAPNLAELTSNGVHEGSNRFEIGNENLKNEQNIQADLNLEYGNTHFEFFANTFYNHINNYIFIAPTNLMSNDYQVYEYLQANARLYGGEFGFHIHPHPIDWLHITSSFETVTGQKQNNEYLPLIPANKLNNSLRTQFSLGKTLRDAYFSANIESYLAQNKNSEFETATNGYSLVNLGLGGSFSIFKMNFDFNCNATNVFNQKYTSHLSRLKSNGILNMGRNIVFGINFKI
ncbi:TonB-dependent receptor [Flavobacterium sp.]|uniref:TonB-dependent receptor n=1 Tax=Flavobacterium sp. TaxID=239 RepID=UPI003D130A40